MGWLYTSKAPVSIPCHSQSFPEVKTVQVTIPDSKVERPAPDRGAEGTFSEVLALTSMHGKGCLRDQQGTWPFHRKFVFPVCILSPLACCLHNGEEAGFYPLWISKNQKPSWHAYRAGQSRKWRRPHLNSGQSDS